MKRHRITKILATVLLFGNGIFAQVDPEMVKLGEMADAMGTEVTFLQDTPVIDGLLDKNLKSLPVRLFPLVYKRKNDKLSPVSFRMAYGMNFFYLYIEAEAEHLTFTDRAWRNGDGFVLLIAAPKPDNGPTDEYYELACSAVNRPELEWTRRIFAGINLDKIFVRTGSAIKLEFREGNGKISFELLLPWKEIVPYHPLISAAMGFNLSFTKATEPCGGEATACYQLVDDLLAPKEKRIYARLKFQKPEVTGKPQIFVGFREGHIIPGAPIHVTIAAVSPAPLADTIRVSIQKESAKINEHLMEKVKFDQGITIRGIAFATNLKPDNGYTIKWDSSANPFCSGVYPLVVMSEFDQSILGKKLLAAQRFLSKSSLATLQFQVAELSGQMKRIKEYETGNDEYLAADPLLKAIAASEQGTDPFRSKTGYLRKAYRSKLDNTLQPYMVYLPENFDAKKHPLFVWLHGSFGNEKEIIGMETMVPKEFIILGPYGRGPNNGFDLEHAQEDIAEALEAVREDYPVDDAKIIISGFSMGGYGVYRTFYETPKKFKAAAVFCGLPHMSTIVHPDESPTPNFLNEQKLTMFKNLPMFIYHGEKDLNAPFALTRQLVEKLKSAGAKVEFVTEPEKGHAEPSKETLKLFYDWLENVIK